MTRRFDCRGARSRHSRFEKGVGKLVDPLERIVDHLMAVRDSADLRVAGEDVRVTLLFLSCPDIFCPVCISLNESSGLFGNNCRS